MSFPLLQNVSIQNEIFSEAATLMFNGQQHMLLMSDSQADLEYDDITLRFKTLEPNGLILALRDDASNQRKKDSMEVSLSRSGIMISVSIAGSKKTSE